VKRQEGGVDFSGLGDEASLRRSRKLWRAVIARVEAGEMPPDGERPLDGLARVL